MKRYRIRGHHLVDLADYLHEPEKARKFYLDEGYGVEFVENQARIIDAFFSGRAVIELIAGKLDDFCLGSCQKRFNLEPGDIGCEDPKGIQVDKRHAALFFLKIGEPYTFEQIETNLRNFYMDQRSM